MGHAYTTYTVNVPLALRYFLRRMYVSSKSFAVFFYVKSSRCHNRLHSTTCTTCSFVRSMDSIFRSISRRSSRQSLRRLHYVRTQEKNRRTRLLRLVSTKEEEILTLRGNYFSESLIKFFKWYN